MAQRPMKRVIIVLAAMLFLQTAQVRGGDITILGNNYKIPKIYSEGGVPRGILVDIARYVDEQMQDHAFHIRLYPWARAYQKALDAEGGIIGLSMTEERLKIFDYSAPVYYDEVIIVVLKGRVFPFQRIQDLKGKRIGIGRGGSFGDDFEKAKADRLFTVDEDSGPVVRLKKLLAGRIDCALLSPGKFAFNDTAEQDEELMRNRDKFAILPEPFKRDPNYLGFSKKMNMQAFLHRFNAVVKAGYENGDIQKRIRRHAR